MNRIKWIAAALLCCLLLGCGRDVVQLPETQPEETIAGFDYRNYDWEQHLKDAVFDTATPLGDAISQAAVLTVEQVTESELTVSVQAPNIAPAMLDWMAAVGAEEFTEDAMQQQIFTQLEAEKQTASFTLPYSVSAQTPQIDYPSDYLDAVSCGLLTFYNDLHQQLIEEMGGTGHE